MRCLPEPGEHGPALFSLTSLIVLLLPEEPELTQVHRPLEPSVYAYFCDLSIDDDLILLLLLLRFVSDSVV